MKFASVKTANEIIKESKEKELSKGFGSDETNLILASLVKAGCKFTI